MALIKCKECGKQISDKASKCVHCGSTLMTNYNNVNKIDKDTTVKKNNRKNFKRR